MFFICGIPRSRTAWLSVWATVNGSPCLHEPQNGCKSKEEYIAKIASMSDSGTGIYYTKIHEHFPHRKILMIKQSGDKLETTKAIYPDAEKAQEFMQSIAGMVVDFYDIDSRIEDIAQFLGINNRFNLSSMRITTMELQDEESAAELLGYA